MNRRDFFRIAGYGLLGALFPGIQKGTEDMPISNILMKMADDQPLSTGEKDELRRWASRTEMANAYVSGLDTAGVSPSVDGLSARRLEVRDRMLIGSALEGKPNLYYDSGTGELQFRQGTTVYNKMSSGSLMAIGARVYRSTNQSIANFTATAISFDAESWDDVGFWVAGSPTRLTIPSGYAGRYEIGMAVSWDADVDGWRLAEVLLNGTTGVIGDGDDALSGLGNGHMGTGIAELAVGDYLELRVLHTAGNALNVVAISGGYSPALWITKIR